MFKQITAAERGGQLPIAPPATPASSSAPTSLPPHAQAYYNWSAGGNAQPIPGQPAAFAGPAAASGVPAAAGPSLAPALPMRPPAVNPATFHQGPPAVGHAQQQPATTLSPTALPTSMQTLGQPQPAAVTPRPFQPVPAAPVAGMAPVGGPRAIYPAPGALHNPSPQALTRPPPSQLAASPIPATASRYQSLPPGMTNAMLPRQQQQQQSFDYDRLFPNLPPPRQTAWTVPSQAATAVTAVPVGPAVHRGSPWVVPSRHQMPQQQQQQVLQQLPRQQQPIQPQQQQALSMPPSRPAVYPHGQAVQTTYSVGPGLAPAALAQVPAQPPAAPTAGQDSVDSLPPPPPPEELNQLNQINAAAAAPPPPPPPPPPPAATEETGARPKAPPRTNVPAPPAKPDLQRELKERLGKISLKTRKGSFH